MTRSRAAADNLLFGEGGNDKLTGGAKGDMLNGRCAGTDSINGADGNDILIGGPNNDTLNGGNGDDILIGAITAYDTDVDALTALLGEWSSSASHAARVQAIRTGTGGSNAPFYLSGTGAKQNRHRRTAPSMSRPAAAASTGSSAKPPARSRTSIPIRWRPRRLIPSDRVRDSIVNT